MQPPDRSVTPNVDDTRDNSDKRIGMPLANSSFMVKNAGNPSVFLSDTIRVTPKTYNSNTILTREINRFRASRYMR